MNKGLNLMKIFYGKEHSEIATSLNNIAFLQTTLGDYENARITHYEALNIRLNLF